MKIAGVITEYNPFHNGHKYQLEQIKEQTGSDYIIVAMSGNFVQRGEPALLDKYLRTEMALLNGADLVIEIPSVAACSSAEYFARTGVSLLESTHLVDTLCYGVENSDKSSLNAIISIFSNSATVKKLNSDISIFMKKGMSYPAAREKAFSQYVSVQDFFSKPNNILALEYEKALPKSITGYPILRIGNDYNDQTISSSFSSATSIRQVLHQNNSAIHWDLLSQNCPDNVIDILSKNINNVLFPNTLSQLLYYKLLLCKDYGYESFADCNQEISFKITKHLHMFKNFEQFCSLLKSKNLTQARIQRVLLHIMLDIKKDDYTLLAAENYAPYIRILGFRKASSIILHELKEKASAPLITKVADASNILSTNASTLFSKDILSSDIYSSLSNFNSNYNEFTKGIIIM